MERTDTVAGAGLSFATGDLRFGDGVAGELPSVLDRLGIGSALLVTDEGVEDAGLLDPIRGSIDAGATYRASTEPSTAAFDDLPEGSFDGVVAVGGGSVLDTAKVASILLAHGGSPADYLGVGAVRGPVLPTVAVPTTSGTGSQATQTAVLAHEGVKRGISDERLRPSAALVDPSMTDGLPPEITARSGFDAFVHALESLTARDYRWVDDRAINYQGANPVTRPLSRRALALVHGHLERAVHDGDDREARRAMSLGSHLAGLAFSNAGLGIVHALASTVGGMVDLPHGACLAASIRPGLTYNLPVRREAYADLARDMGLVGAGATAEDGAAALIGECDRLRDAVGLPGSFSAAGLDRGDVDAIVENTLLQERRLATNPRAAGEDLRDAIAAGFD